MKKITILAMHLNYGGIEKYISYLCKMFENDYDLEVISTYKYSSQPAFEFSPKIKITYLLNDYPDRVSIKELLNNQHYIKVISEIYRRIRLRYMSYYYNKKVVKNLKSDYLITTRIYHNRLVNKYLKKSRIIKIATEHNYHNNNQKYINELVRSTTNFNYFIHCTDELYKFYRKLITGPKNKKIYNPVFIDNKLKSKLNNLNIISVGRFSEEKGFLDLIEVMKEVCNINPKVSLKICGDGYLREKIKIKINEYGLNDNVQLTGFVRGKDLERAYMDSSLYVMTSKSESFGLVLLEAMHYGIPCIAFDSASGARNLLKNKVGILIKDRDIKKMARGIVKLLEDRKKLMEYSDKSISYVTNYSLEKTYSSWQKILN